MRLKTFYLLLLFLFPISASAVSPSSILVNIAPESPAPNESVNISLNSYVSNLDSISISWSVGGKTVASGTGKKSIAVTAPAAGKEMRVSANVMLPDGNIEKVMLIRPTVMALLWQANDSYVPPFYRGKALPSTGGEIKIVALPEAKGTSPRNLVYNWKKDYTNDAPASGYGKNFYLFTQYYLEDANTVSVAAAT